MMIHHHHFSFLFFFFEISFLSYLKFIIHNNNNNNNKQSCNRSMMMIRTTTSTRRRRAPPRLSGPPPPGGSFWVLWRLLPPGWDGFVRLQDRLICPIHSSKRRPHPTPGRWPLSKVLPLTFRVLSCRSCHPSSKGVFFFLLFNKPYLPFLSRGMCLCRSTKKGESLPRWVHTSHGPLGWWHGPCDW